MGPHGGQRRGGEWPIQGGLLHCHPQTSSPPALGTSMGRGWRIPPRLGGPGRRRRMRPSWRKVGAGGVAPQWGCGAGPRAPQKGRGRGTAEGGQCHGAAPGMLHPPHPPPPRAPRPQGTQRSWAARAGGLQGYGAEGGPRLRAVLGRGLVAPPAWGRGFEVLMESKASSPGRGRALGGRGSPNPNPPRSPERKKKRVRRRRSGRRNGVLGNPPPQRLIPGGAQRELQGVRPPRGAPCPMGPSQGSCLPVLPCAPSLCCHVRTAA